MIGEVRDEVRWVVMLCDREVMWSGGYVIGKVIDEEIGEVMWLARWGEVIDDVTW